MKKIYFVFVFSHLPFISLWGHIDPEDTFRTTESSPGFCVCV